MRTEADRGLPKSDFLSLKAVSNVGRAVGRAVAPVLVSGALAVGLGADKARAAPFEWSSYTDIVPSLSPVNGNPISSIDYTSSSVAFAPNNLSAIYFIVDVGAPYAVGGFDVVNGRVTSSAVNGWSTYYGLTTGQTANSDGNPAATDAGGYWEVFYDYDGDGSYGEANRDIQGVFIDRNEQLLSSQYTVLDFSPFDSVNPGNFTFTTTIPEPSSLVLLGVGAAALALRRRSDKRNKSDKRK